MTPVPLATAPSLADIDEIARQAFENLPHHFRSRCTDVVLRIEEFPSDDVVADMQLESPFDILGLYQGTELTHKSFSESGSLPDMVFLYRRPILDYWCESGETLRHIVTHVLVHEIGHHFGFSDDDMDAIEAAAQAEEDAPA